jgi:Domain of unknown function (DUF222)
VLSVAALGGHAIMPPGPDLAGWLACSEATERDDAALVTSITAWRKVTSWAQAQELAAVAELARRRRVAGAVEAGGQDCDRAADAGDRGPVADVGRCDPDLVAELEAGFAPNEVALALTLTQGGAEYWMDLAVSLAHRLPATLAALGEGAIDLNRAKLIGQYTSSLDAGLAGTVERRVLARAEHQTTGQLRASLQRAVLAADPAAAERRRQEAQQRAWVALFGDHDGTARRSARRPSCPEKLMAVITLGHELLRGDMTRRYSLAGPGRFHHPPSSSAIMAPVGSRRVNPAAPVPRDDGYSAGRGTDETARIDRAGCAGRSDRSRLDAAGPGLYQRQLHDRRDVVGGHRADCPAGRARDHCSRAPGQAAVREPARGLTAPGGSR